MRDEIVVLEHERDAALLELDKTLSDLQEAVSLLRLVHDPNAKGEYCSCVACEYVADHS